jgi:uncharacterized membrane protein
MKWISRSAGAILIAGIVFLLFLFCFEEWLKIPSWLQVAGRMHPLMLHFPIVLILISIVSYWMPSSDDTTKNGWNLIRLFAVITAIISAIMGMILSIEQQDSGEVLVYHKWAGVSLALIAAALYQFHDWIIQRHNYGKIASVITFFLLLFTGHWGATLTQGDNYLTGPLLSAEKKNVNPEEARMFADIIKPILDDKCGNCHLGHNQKGGLSLNDSASIALAGKTGNALVAGDLMKSLLITRMHLPMNDKKHMPVADKPQLTNNEIALIEAWVKAGAPFEQKLTDRNTGDSLRILALTMLRDRSDGEEEVNYDFKAASASTINKLNNNYRVIKQLGKNSPALSVSFFGKAIYKSEHLKELSEIKEQVLHLNLSKMPVEDAEATTIQSFPNLERLNLNYTNITDKAIQQLASLPKLRSISAAGTAISMEGLKSLLSNKQITEIFIWDSKVNMDEVVKLQKQHPGIQIDEGFQGADTMVVKLNKAIFKTPEGFFHDSGKVVISHVIKGTELRYTTDGSDPDSCVGAIYKEPITVTKNTVVRVKSFKKGWGSSEEEKRTFMKAGLPIVKTILVTPADPKYYLNGEKLLNDLDLGDIGDFGTKWLGYQKNDAIIIFDLGEEKKINEVIVNAGHNIGGYIFPPVTLSLWGSHDGKEWTALKSLSPTMPTKIIPATAFLYEMPFSPRSFRFLKIQGQPIKKLPEWHPGKGKPGWFFLSEVIVY